MAVCHSGSLATSSATVYACIPPPLGLPVARATSAARHQSAFRKAWMGLVLLLVQRAELAQIFRIATRLLDVCAVLSEGSGARLHNEPPFRSRAQSHCFGPGLKCLTSSGHSLPTLPARFGACSVSHTFGGCPRRDKEGACELLWRPLKEFLVFARHFAFALVFCAPKGRYLRQSHPSSVIQEATL
jgi:hypothetical protein